MAAPVLFYLIGLGHNSDSFTDLGPATLNQVRAMIKEKNVAPVAVDQSVMQLSAYAFLPQGYTVFVASSWYHIFAVKPEHLESWDRAYHACVSRDSVGAAMMLEIAKNPVAAGEHERQLNMRLQYGRCRAIIHGFKDSSEMKFDVFHYERALKEKFVTTDTEFHSWKALVVAQKAADGQNYRPFLRAWIPCAHGPAIKLAIDVTFFNRINAAFKMTDEQKAGMKVHVSMDVWSAPVPCKNKAEPGKGFKCACMETKAVPDAPADAKAPTQTLKPASSLKTAQEVAALIPAIDGLAALLNGAISNPTPASTAPVPKTESAPDKEKKGSAPPPEDSKQEKKAQAPVVSEEPKASMPPPSAKDQKTAKRARPVSSGTPTSPSYDPKSESGYDDSQIPPLETPKEPATSSVKKTLKKPVASNRFKVKQAGSKTTASGEPVAKKAKTTPSDD